MVFVAALFITACQGEVKQKGVASGKTYSPFVMENTTEEFRSIKTYNDLIRLMKDDKGERTLFENFITKMVVLKATPDYTKSLIAAQTGIHSNLNEGNQGNQIFQNKGKVFDKNAIQFEEGKNEEVLEKVLPGVKGYSELIKDDSQFSGQLLTVGQNNDVAVTLEWVKSFYGIKNIEQTTYIDITTDSTLDPYRIVTRFDKIHKGGTKEVDFFRIYGSEADLAPLDYRVDIYKYIDDWTDVVNIQNRKWEHFKGMIRDQYELSKKPRFTTELDWLEKYYGEQPLEIDFESYIDWYKHLSQFELYDVLNTIMKVSYNSLFKVRHVGDSIADDLTVEVSGVLSRKERSELTAYYPIKVLLRLPNLNEYDKKEVKNNTYEITIVAALGNKYTGVKDNQIEYKPYYLTYKMQGKTIQALDIQPVNAVVRH